MKPGFSVDNETAKEADIADMAHFTKMADDSRAYLFAKTGYKPDIFAERFKI